MYRARFPCTPEAARDARRVLKSLLSAWFGEPDLSDGVSAIGEALANCVEHGRGRDIIVRLRYEGTRVTVEIEGGRGFDFLAAMRRSEEGTTGSLRGYGIRIMRAFMDSVEYAEGGRVLRLTKKLPVDPAREENGGAS